MSRASWSIGVLAALASVPATAGAHTAAAVRLSRHPIALSRRWQSYDEAPAQAIVRPMRVIEVSGEVSDPQALANPSSGQTTTLTYPIGGQAPSLILDYGKDVGGYGTFDVAAASGTGLEAAYSETLANMGNDGDATVGLLQSGDVSRTDTFVVLGSGVQTGPLIQGAERYEKVTLTLPGTVTLRSAGIEFTPLRETPSAMQGHFLSSDQLLNRIWYAGAYTLNLNQMTPGTLVDEGQVTELHLILDGAKRDRAVWSGDQLISGLTDMYVSDPAYERDSLMLLLTHPATTADFLVPAVGDMSQPGPLPGVCSPNPLAGNICVTWSASYSIVVIPGLYNYYLYTGDLGFVRAHWQAVVRQMEWDAQQVDSNGLFTVNSIDADDWNLESPTGEVTYVNALYLEALESASKLAAALGETAEASQWASAAVKVKNAVNRILWDPRTGVYDPSETLRGPVVQDANVLAILSGIASGSRAQEILAVLRQALATQYGPAIATTNATGYVRDISPYMGGFNVLADFASGETADALGLIRQEWGYMVNHDPGGTDWERIELDGIPAGGSTADSLAHGWSTGPTPALSEYVLGVAPASPGYRTWSVKPELGNLRWAQGVVPTPHGSLSVAWKRGVRNRSFEITVTGPAGASGTVAIPLLGRDRTIARNGRVVWRRGRAVRGVRARRVGGVVVFGLGAGMATYAWVV